MVSYQKWTSLVFEQVPQDRIESPNESQNVVSVAADVWNDRTAELSAATVSEAREIAQQEIVVR